MTTRARTNSTTETNNMATDTALAGMRFMISMAGLTGVWGVACMISAIARSGGILEMARNYITAIGI
ncbi:MAG: hypothetical protein OEV91_04070 [Desulfobulbaceae bacterium]|nr:hypothetical protein [Desulfobulbaceae bacterium]